MKIRATFISFFKFVIHFHLLLMKITSDNGNNISSMAYADNWNWNSRIVWIIRNIFDANKTSFSDFTKSNLDSDLRLRK